MHFFFTAFWEEVILDHPSGGAAGRSGRPTFYHGEGAVVVGFVETKLPSVFQIRWRCPRGQLQGNKLTSPCPMVPALWKMVRNCRAICREWSQRWWKKTRYDMSFSFTSWETIGIIWGHLYTDIIKYNIYTHTHIFVIWWQVLVLLLSVFWFLYDTWYSGQRVTTSVQEGVQPGSVLTVAVPNPGGVPQGSTRM